MTKHITLESLGALALTLAVVVPAGCKKGDKGKRERRVTVQASISDFDPNADVTLDLDKFGTERVDDWALQQAFNTSFDAMDTCVADAKKRHHMSEDSTLPGDLHVAIKLNPSGKPFGVNLSISSKKWDGDAKLESCLKEAVDNVDYPTWDGPPQVADFDLQLDPGSTYEDE